MYSVYYMYTCIYAEDIREKYDHPIFGWLLVHMQSVGTRPFLPLFLKGPGDKLVMDTLLCILVYTHTMHKDELHLYNFDYITTLCTLQNVHTCTWLCSCYSTLHCFITWTLSPSIPQHVHVHSLVHKKSTTLTLLTVKTNHNSVCHKSTSCWWEAGSPFSFTSKCS